MRKFILRVAAATSLVSCLLVSGAAAAQKKIAPRDSPIAVLESIYGQYPDTDKADDWHKADKAWTASGAPDNLPGWDTLPLSRATAEVNRRVNKALAKSGDICLDYDPISDSQDPDIARYKIVPPSVSSPEKSEHQVYLQGKTRTGTTKVRYVFVKEQGRWRVDDIVTYSTDARHRPVANSIKDMLKACLKNQKRTLRPVTKPSRRRHTSSIQPSPNRSRTVAKTQRNGPSLASWRLRQTSRRS